MSLDPAVPPVANLPRKARARFHRRTSREERPSARYNSLRCPRTRRAPLMRDAAQYASGRLTEVETPATFVEDLHAAAPPVPGSRPPVRVSRGAGGFGAPNTEAGAAYMYGDAYSGRRAARAGRPTGCSPLTRRRRFEDSRSPAYVSLSKAGRPAGYSASSRQGDHRRDIFRDMFASIRDVVGGARRPTNAASPRRDRSPWRRWRSVRRSSGERGRWRRPR